jgi:DNA replication protein DnaC
MTLHTLSNGLILPSELYVQIKPHGAPVLLGNPAGNRLCLNCGGLREMRLLFLKPYEGKGPNTWHEGKWHGYDERRAPCPVCADSTERVAALRSASNLMPDEFNIDPAYCKRYAEKAGAVQAALELLAMTPYPRGWLSIHGSYGVGKTMLCKGLVAKFCAAGVAAHYTTAAKILSALRATYDDHNTEAERDVMARYQTVRVLVVDEVDRASETAWAREKLFSVLDDRYTSRQTLLTLICTNSAPGKMNPEWQYLESRMRDGMRVVMGGADLRGVKS